MLRENIEIFFLSLENVRIFCYCERRSSERRELTVDTFTHCHIRGFNTTSQQLLQFLVLLMEREKFFFSTTELLTVMNRSDQEAL